MVKTQKIHVFVKNSFISPTFHNTFSLFLSGNLPGFRKIRMLDFRRGVWYDEHINKLKKFGKPDVSQGRKVRSLLHLPPGQKPQKVVRLQWVLSFSRGGVLLRLFLHRCV